MTTPVPRMILFGLLTLMQVIAPWVHAHTGGETGGFLHVPGLEFLAKGEKVLAQLDTSPIDQDVIVGVQAGFWGEIHKAKFSPTADDQPCLLFIAASIRRPQLAADLSSFDNSPPPSSHAYPKAAPRAPPLKS